MNAFPGARHGLVCARIVHALMSYLESNPLGRVWCNQAGLITSGDDNTVRGPDIAYCSYQRLPREQAVPGGYASVMPELLIEVLSPTDHWKELLPLVQEYLSAGAMTVQVLDLRRDQMVVFNVNQPEETRDRNDDMVAPGILPDFSVPLASLLVG